MPNIKSNEREFNGQVISWLNESLNQGSYPFEVATSEYSLKVDTNTTNFPDVQLWLNREAKLGFCLWELKPPRISEDDAKLLENAAEKSRAISADYFVTWNMKNTVIWRTPQKGEKVSSEHRYKTYSAIYQVTTPDDLWVASKKALLKSRAKEILNDLLTIQQKGHLHLIDVDSIYFVHKLSEAVKTLWPYIHKSLITQIGKDAKFKRSLFDWAVKQGIATKEADETFFEAISRQIVYRLLGKILFYLTLKRFRADIPALDLNETKPEAVSEKLKEYFRIARQIDYQAVFEEDFTDTVPFPSGSIDPLIMLLNDLNRYNFSRMPHDVIGNVFEKLIPPEERHTLGQYFTNEDLVDLTTAFCVQTKSDKVLDPTCGTGTFLIRAYDRLKNSGEKDHKKLISQIWGFDIAHFPAELAVINLYRQKIEDYSNFPRILSMDFFDVATGMSFKFPPPKLTEGSDFMIDEEIPKFDAIVGNFPYIRQELIEKRIKGYKNHISDVLAKGWNIDYPDFFTKKGDPKLSGQADIYAYLFFHAATHLKEGGRMGIVTSNSWLDVAYGHELQKLFLKKFKIIAIYESRCEPWFEDAAVNTVVTVIEKCSDKEDRNNHHVKFVKIKKRLKELIPWDIKSPLQRWIGLDKLIHTIETAGSQYCKIKECKPVSTLSGHITYEDDDFRIRVLNQGELLEEVTETGKTVKWGKYLRAPEIYFDLLEKCGDKLVPLKDISEVRFGIKSGVNEFFHLDEDKIKHWGIEEEFLVPIVKSFKELDRVIVDKSLETKISLFKCNKVKEDLRGTKALKYIKFGESQVTKDGVPYPKVPSVKSRKRWYDIGDREPWDIFTQENWGNRFFMPINEGKFLADKRLYEIKAKGDSRLLASLLNSTLAILFMEVMGRANLGEGALDLAVYEFEDMLIIDPDQIQPTKILKAFNKLLSRPIKDIFEEVNMKDRQKLDSAVLEAIGLDPKKYLKPLYEGLTELVRERLDLAKSRKKAKKTKTKQNLINLKEQVIEDVIPNGVKNFPEEFIDSKYLKDSKEVPVPKTPLKLGHYFMGTQEIVSAGGFKYDAANIDEAKFIIYSQKSDSYIVKVPKQRPAIVNAVKGYERHLKKIKAKLFEEFFNRTINHKQADTLTNQVMKELNLPQG